MESTLTNKFNSNNIVKYWKDQKPPHIINKRKLKEPFVDPFFPPNQNSLLSLDEDGNYIDQEEGEEMASEIDENSLQWKRASEILKNCSVFQDKIEFDDIKQGNIGNCYFLSSISAITEFPHIIYEKFRTKVFDPLGYYEIALFIDGEWQVVFVDDYFPVFKGTRQFAFAKPNGSELWVILLEKAWAKVNGGYSNTIAGLVSEPLFTLTGFSTEYIQHREKALTLLWNKLLNAENEDKIMCCATKPDPSIENVGLVEGHAYTLISAKNYEKYGESIQLLKIRNPWGCKEWNGNWSDKSDLWTPELKKYFGHVNKDDGTFFMALEDYVEYFTATNICHIMYDAFMKHYTFDYEKHFHSPVVFNIFIEEDSKVSLSVIFRNWRFNRHLKKPVRPFNLLISRYNSEREILSLDGEYSASENIEYVKDLKKGSYIVWMYLPYDTYKSDKPFKYTFRISSMSRFNSKFIGLDDKFLVIQKILVENTKISQAKAIDSCQSFYVGCDKDSKNGGISSLIIINKDKDWMNVQLTARNLYNVKILPPYTDMQSIELNIPPFQGAAISGSRLSYSYVDFDFKVKASIVKNNQIFKPLMLESFFTMNHGSNDKPDFGLTYRFISRENAKYVPNFEQQEESKVKVEKQLTLEDLLEENTQAVSLLKELDPQGEFDEKQLKWTIFKAPEGDYLGQIDSEGKFNGRGAFIWNNEGDNHIYIGYWSDGKMDKKGKVYTSNYNIIYDGSYSKGKRTGMGNLFFENGDHYEGLFEDDKMQGTGIYYFSNGNFWEGPFENNMKQGKGLMKFPDHSFEIVEFENDNILKTTILERKETEKLKEEMKENVNVKDIVGNFTKIGDSILKILDEKHEDNPVEVKTLDHEIVETEEEIKKKKREEKLKELKLRDQFMFDMLMELEQLEENEELDYVEQNNGYYIGALSSKQRNGRGAYFWKNNFVAYHVGYWEYNNAVKYGRRFDQNKNLVYEGNFENNCYHGQGKMYYNNGDTYEGHFEQNKRHGNGTFTWFNNGRWEGEFFQDKFHGSGKFYYFNSPFTEIIVYDNGNISSRFDYKNEEESSKENLIIANFKNQFPEIMNKILALPNIRSNEEVKFVHLNNNNGFYLGQTNSKGEKHGRGCYYWNNSTISFYLGYWENDHRTGRGFYYKSIQHEQLIYEGEFKMNQMHGRGRYFYDNGDKYDGHFKFNKRNGIGVYTWSDGGKWEGKFNEDQFEGDGVYVYSDGSKTESFEYSQSNVVSRSNCIDHNDIALVKQKRKELNSLLVDNKLYLDKILALNPTYDDPVLKWTKKDCREGYYLGQVNSHEQNHGRGMMFYLNTKQFYIGYWENGFQQGWGTFYYNENKIQYEGQHNYDKRVGNGKYYFLSNNDHYEGNLDELGNGDCVYYWSDGSYWEGHINHKQLHGEGRYFDAMKNFCGIKTFQYNKEV